MAQTASYGMGQYRYISDFDYVTFLGSTATLSKRNEEHEINSNIYQDVAIELPHDLENNSAIKYGETYYLTLTIPKNLKYNTNINLKLCAEDSNGKVNFNKFQQIKQVTIPSINNGETIFSDVVLFEYENNVYAQIPENFETGAIAKNKTLYANNTQYKYCSPNTFESGHSFEDWDDDYLKTIGNNYTEYTLLQGWKTQTSSSNNNTNLVEIAFVFSPKYNLAESYKYLLLEIVRNEDGSIQYIEENKTYTGQKIDTNSVQAAFYKVNNLLPVFDYGLAPVKSGINTLNYINIIGTTNNENLREIPFAINGEEIKVEANGQYELKDFDINFLGAVVVNPTIENQTPSNLFVITYGYKIEN